MGDKTLPFVNNNTTGFIQFQSVNLSPIYLYFNFYVTYMAVSTNVVRLKQIQNYQFQNEKVF